MNREKNLKVVCIDYCYICFAQSKHLIKHLLGKEHFIGKYFDKNLQQFQIKFSYLENWLILCTSLFVIQFKLPSPFLTYILYLFCISSNRAYLRTFWCTNIWCGGFFHFQYCVLMALGHLLMVQLCFMLGHAPAVPSREKHKSRKYCKKNNKFDTIH